MYKRRISKPQDEMLWEIRQEVGDLVQLVVVYGSGGTTRHRKIKRLIKRYRNAGYEEKPLLYILVKAEIELKMKQARVPWKSVL